MPTTLITGANRGLGLEFARQYAHAGWHVLAGCRLPDQASDLQAVAHETGRIEVLQLDVKRADQIAAIARQLDGRPIDVLINNAGAPGSPARLGELDYDEWLETLAVNTLGPIRLAEALRDNVAASEQKRIVAISSGLASIAQNTSGGRYSYRTSKTALNAAIRSLAMDLRGRGVIAVVLSPGWVRTRMGGAGAPLGAEQSVDDMRRVIAGLTREDTGASLNHDGTRIPW